jgi:hypothetical protein
MTIDNPPPGAPEVPADPTSPEPAAPNPAEPNPPLDDHLQGVDPDIAPTAPDEEGRETS